MVMLKTIQFIKEEHVGFPYDLPFIDQVIHLDYPITVITGDNGCGKTTLLELIQSSLDLYDVGTSMTEKLKVKTKATYDLLKPKGFYFSSEDFTTYIYELEKEKAYATSQIKVIDETYKDKTDFAKMMAKSAHQKSLYQIEGLHDRNLLKSSHGESYLSFFKSRMRDHYLILLDEPETPLSFQNQLSLLYILHEAINRGCQLIISTHSPLIMAYPHAHLLHMDHQGLHEVTYENIENVMLMKDFLNDPNRFFNHLFKK